RPVTPQRLAHWCDILREGRYIKTHQGIAISNCLEPRMLDGGGRCRAVMETGTQIQISFAFGVNPAAFPVIDARHAVRTNSNAMSVRFPDRSQRDVGTIAEAATLHIRLSDKCLSNQYRADDLVAWVDLVPEFAREELLKIAYRVGGRLAPKGHKGIPKALFVALIHIVTHSKRAKSNFTAFEAALEIFLAQLEHGQSLHLKSPILHLRNALMKLRIGEELSNPYARTAKTAVAIMHAWNIFALGGTVPPVRGLDKLTEWEPNDALPSIV